MQLQCKLCQLLVSNPIQELPDKGLLLEVDGADFIPKGYYTLDDKNYFTDFDAALLINEADLINCKDYPDASRLNGCCGLDGCDGPNKVCLNGHEIGTEKSDCWVPHLFIFGKDKVEILP